MNTKEKIWLGFVLVYTMYRVSFANTVANALGVLVAGGVLGFLPIYIGRRLRRRTTEENIKQGSELM